jgi:hypothetical protein
MSPWSLQWLAGGVEGAGGEAGGAAEQGGRAGGQELYQYCISSKGPALALPPSLSGNPTQPIEKHVNVKPSN